MRSDLRLWAGVLTMAIMAVMAPKASAVNPANFAVSLATSGEDVFFNSPVAVDTGFPTYDYTVVYTSVIVVLDVFSIPTDHDITDQLTNAAGSFISLPNTLVNEMVSEPGVLDVDVFLEVDASGVTNASLTNIVFGQFLGFDIIGL